MFVGCLFILKTVHTVNHKILCEKLYHYVIKGPAHLWFKSYLNYRKQKVQINSIDSSLVTISFRVPQGSILGPLLFLIYINDLKHAIQKLLVHHFADDTNLIVSNKSLKTLRKTTNKEIQSLCDWLCANRLTLNVAKTENSKINFTLCFNNKTLHEFHHFMYSGILIDNKLILKSHINYLMKTLGRTISLLSKIRL